MVIPKKGERIKIDIQSLAYGGIGVGKIDDYVVFVEGALPGETVTAQIYKRKKNYAESRVLQIETESRFRIKPVCQHFPLCGGCRLQYLDYDKQAEFKKDQLCDSFRQIGRLKNPPVSTLIKSDTPFYYRNKMEYSFGISYEGDLQLGLHPRRSYGRVFDLEECYLQSEESSKITAAIRKSAIELEISPYDIKKHNGLLRYCMIKEGKNTNQRMINIVTSESAEEQVREIINHALVNAGDIDSIVNNVNTKKANIAYGEYENLIQGNSYITEDISGIKYRISANSFFQTNSLSAAKLFDSIENYIDLQGDESVLDLYCGTGSISFSISKRAKRIVGVDSESSAIEDAIQNRELNGITNCQFFTTDSLDYMKVLISEGKKYDVVIADPPRPGLHPKMIPLLGKLASPKFIYVSCNPAALARDYQMLTDVGYKLEDVTCVDMFPQTPHIESVAFFKM
ncbi:MAG: 23S rRNA (uracil(1939)-C(5))-methyltransferase RlmD [candidate division Zixibacteria bacterium]|nr:23S rRNA (uracil(1939)-C(5))-methyltransferase RlmD [candidate division Zixibacteria bacterium]